MAPRVRGNKITGNSSHAATYNHPQANTGRSGFSPTITLNLDPRWSTCCWPKFATVHVRKRPLFWTTLACLLKDGLEFVCSLCSASIDGAICSRQNVHQLLALLVMWLLLLSPWSNCWTNGTNSTYWKHCKFCQLCTWISSTLRRARQTSKGQNWSKMDKHGLFERQFEVFWTVTSAWPSVQAT